MVYQRKHSPSKPKPTGTTKKILLIGGIIVVVVGLVVLLEGTNTTHLFHARKAVSGPIPTKTTPTQPNSQNNDNSTTPSQPDNTTTAPKTSPGSGSTTDTTAPLVAPYGSFVSNHKPGQNGSPTAEQSTCVTTPGATCTIIFTNGGIQKTLESRTADSSGIATWDWDIKQSGLTKGTWHITATAHLGEQTKSTDDANSLEIL